MTDFVIFLILLAGAGVGVGYGVPHLISVRRHKGRRIYR
jgi:hypothetical protein